MSTRSYSGTLIFENVFDAIPASNTFLNNVANQVFSPQPEVIEEDCGTLLGEVMTLTFESEGFVSVVTGLPIDRAYIESLLSQGVYEVQTRNLSSCISEGGVCQKCYGASKPSATTPLIGTRVRIDPEFQMQSEVFSIRAGYSTAQLSYNNSVYDVIYIVNNGQVLSSSSFTISGKTLTLTTPVVSDTIFVAKYSVISRAPFFYWLAKTYGGSLLGLKPLPIRPLTLKPSLLSLLIPDVEIESLVQRISSSQAVPEDMRMYLSGNLPKMEKALLAIAVDSIFSNATN